MQLRTLHWAPITRELLLARLLSPHAHFPAHSWSLPVTSALALTAVLYLRGWVRVRSAVPSTGLVWRPVAFVSGLLVLWIAVGSPIRSLDEEMLLVHMVKHLLVMVVAAPLLLLGVSHLPLAYPFLDWPPVARLTRALTHPVFCWLSATVAVMVWHVPAVFALGMRSQWWHLVQFTSFLAAGLLFWWPVIQPWQKARWSRWSIPVYLFLATLPCDVLSAYLTFCDDVVYAPYLGASPASNASALQDQQAAGALMWVFITFVYLLPAIVIAMQMLSPRGQRDPEHASRCGENPGMSPVTTR